jgi:putative solute:sodium symporter small subunit
VGLSPENDCYKIAGKSIRARFAAKLPAPAAGTESSRCTKRLLLQLSTNIPPAKSSCSFATGQLGTSRQPRDVARAGTMGQRANAWWEELMATNIEDARRRHWSKTFWLTIIVLIIWFVFSFGVHFVGTELNRYEFLGFPLGFYLAAQGSLIVFVVTIFVQNWIQDRIDDTYVRQSGETEM